MRTRRVPLLAAVALSAVLAGLVFAPAALAAQAPRCQQRAGQTLIQNRSIRVLETITPVGRDGQAYVLRVFLCRIGQRTQSLLLKRPSDLDEASVVQDATLGGTRWIVLHVAIEGGVTDGDSLLEFDAKSGKPVFAYTVEGSELRYGVGRDGGLAVLSDDDGVLALDADGRRALSPLPTPPASGPADLAVAGNTVYWTAQGAPQSALLRGHPTALAEPAAR